MFMLDHVVQLVVVTTFLSIMMTCHTLYAKIVDVNI